MRQQDSQIFGYRQSYETHTCFFPSFNEKPPIFGTKKQGRSPKSFSEIHPDLPKSTAFFTFRLTLQAWPSEPSEDVVDGIMDPLERQEVLASLGFRCAFGSKKSSIQKRLFFWRVHDVFPCFLVFRIVKTSSTKHYMFTMWKGTSQDRKRVSESFCWILRSRFWLHATSTETLGLQRKK